MNFDGIEAVIYTGGRSERLPSRPLPEAQIMELRAAVALYEKDCPFRVGDLVTPKANAPYRNQGGIHIVAEVFTTSPIRDNGSSSGEWAYYGKLDMRVIYIADNGDTVPHMVESWLFEPYTGECATAQEEPAGSPVTEEEIRATDALVDADGWKSWNGGKRFDDYPSDVKPDMLVEVGFRGGDKAAMIASELNWTHDTAQADIIRYRVCF